MYSCFGLAGTIKADPVTLTFDGLTGQVLNFYDGGFTSTGNGPGPNFGVTFSSNVRAGSGHIFFVPQDPSCNPCFGVMNVSGGFVSELSLLAATSSVPFGPPAVVVSIYDGLNGTGNLLAQTPAIAPGNILQPFSVTFNGIARSVTLGGIAGFSTFDNITFTSAQAAAVPEPATTLLFAAGLVGAVRAAHHRKRGDRAR
jgi:hypothetical protein